MSWMEKNKNKKHLPKKYLFLGPSHKLYWDAKTFFHFTAKFCNFHNTCASNQNFSFNKCVFCPDRYKNMKLLPALVVSEPHIPNRLIYTPVGWGTICYSGCCIACAPLVEGTFKEFLLISDVWLLTVLVSQLCSAWLSTLCFYQNGRIVFAEIVTVICVQIWASFIHCTSLVVLVWILDLLWVLKWSISVETDCTLLIWV